jgi:hypothetical protein
MRSVFAAMIVALFLLTAGAVMADSVPGNDPNIGVKGGHHSTPLNSLDFNFTINAQGGGIFDFVNESGVNWTSLTLLSSAPIGSSYSCNPVDFGHLFENCSTNVTSQDPQTGQEAVTIVFSGTTPGCVFLDCFPGIPQGFHFFFNLNDDFNCNEGCSGGWTDNYVVQGMANNVPEPASIFLVLTGLGGIVARRRRSAYLARRT